MNESVIYNDIDSAWIPFLIDETCVSIYLILEEILILKESKGLILLLDFSVYNNESKDKLYLSIDR